jgi:hypothetical protein
MTYARTCNGKRVVYHQDHGDRIAQSCHFMCNGSIAAPLRCATLRIRRPRWRAYAYLLNDIGARHGLHARLNAKDERHGDAVRMAGSHELTWRAWDCPASSLTSGAARRMHRLGPSGTGAHASGLARHRLKMSVHALAVPTGRSHKLGFKSPPSVRLRLHPPRVLHVTVEVGNCDTGARQSDRGGLFVCVSLHRAI